MNIFSYIKKTNKEYSKKLIDTDKYWQKSPSNLLLKQATLESLAEYGKDKKVLDAGAGRLAYRPLIKLFTNNYTSSDFKKTHDQLDVVTDIEKMSFKDKTFDLVFCSQVLEHVPHPNKALTEINRILKSKGHVVITVPLLGYIHNAPYDFYRYTRFGLETLAKDSGFKVIKLEELGGFFSFLGYVRSTFVMPLFGLPLVGSFIFTFNHILSKIDILLDKLLPNKKVFPLNYLLILEKK